mmetsp:Transcript_21330/g.53428  ORF Transcript_21330/g.53428 Transcript_21330/m.53428 type:complete len:436 (+) Transcript_21330:98-1405(+)
MEEADALQHLQEQYSQLNQEMLQHGARIVIMGGTGVGKTSVMNAAFDSTLGEVGHAIPCTQDIRVYAPTTACPVWVYDTKGFEPLSDNEDIFASLRQLKEERRQAASEHPIDSAEHHAERLHAVWWVTDNRFEKSLADCVEATFGDEFPIFVVVNKCDKAAREVDDVIEIVTTSCPWATAVIPVVATPKNGPLRKVCEACGQGRILCSEEERLYMCRNQDCTKKSQDQQLKPHYGIEDLLSKTVECLPELVAVSFYHAQQDWLEDLDWKADALIAVHVSAAVAIGASPIPFSDFPLLMSNEVAMFGFLANIYGVNVDPSVIKEVLGAFAGLSAGAMGGLLLGSVLKCVPGVGSIFGGCTDAAIAGSVTAAVGAVVKELLRRVRALAVCGDIKAEHFFQVMRVEDQKALFKEALQGARRRHGVRSGATRPALAAAS